MQSRYMGRAIVLVVLTVSGLAYSNAQTTYDAQVIGCSNGTPYGPKVTARDLNNAGQVTGRIEDLTQPWGRSAFIWQNGAIRTLNPPGPQFQGGDGYAINAQGLVAAQMYMPSSYVRTEAYVLGGRRAVRVSPTNLNPFITTVFSPVDINESGQTVGLDQGASRSWVNLDGRPQDLGDLGGAQTAAKAMNSAGQVVGAGQASGSSNLHAFLWQNGNITELPGGCCSSANSINSLGAIAGSASLGPQGQSHAVMWQAGTPIDLTPVAVYALAQHINDYGVVVGAVIDAGSSQQVAFVTVNGVPSDLNTRLVSPLPAGLGPLSDAIRINDSGQILAISGSCSVLLSPAATSR